MEVVGRLLRGGQDAFQAAGVTLVGGHSMYCQELFYGAAVTGLIHPRRIVTNAHAQPGDQLVLTKPLGTGIVAYAVHGRLAPADIVARAVAVMKALNRDASEAMVELGAHAATDITGYGLCGHAFQLAEASRVTVHIEADRLPLIDGLEPLLDQVGETTGQVDNRELCGDRVSVADSVPGLLRAVCFDPQTSGGLLVSLAQAGAEALVRQLRGRGVEATVVGRVTRDEGYSVLVE
jgi:selenide,water dikinase